MNDNTLYISLDIEADGPVPGLYSMISLGAVAFQNGQEVAEFYKTMDPLPDATQHPDTMKFWARFPEAWEEVNTNTVNPGFAMLAFHNWLSDLRNSRGGGLTAVGYPAAFDYMFVNWYMVNFLNQNIMGFSALDIKSYAAGLLRRRYRKTVKHEMPEEWFEGLPEHTHIAIDDAREQGMLFMNILKWEKENA
jgi:DNA polymerase III epsilon subunit-like protein